MKKKILFVIPEYSHGGTNKSLENLLGFMDKTKYNISVYSLYKDGGLSRQVEKGDDETDYPPENKGS